MIMATPQTSSGAQKSVLACMGDRKREVIFTEEGSLLSAVRETFADVLQGDEEILLQVKHEDWNGEFTVCRQCA